MSTHTILNQFETFNVDNAIVSDLIHSQNGTVATSIRELVLNAIDAGSPTCAIRLGKDTFEVTDKGHGFEDKESISKHFKTFGTPHIKGDVKFGRFRIGRGQIMAMGAITWHSNEFQMSTDIQTKKDGFTLRIDPENAHAGCKVSGTFYKSLNSWDLSQVKDELEKFVKYASEEITLNGVLISDDNSTQWDYEDEDVKIKWNPKKEDGISIYSLGVFVKTVNNYVYGINADVVTKKALKLNMARNEITDTDPLWVKIANFLQERSIVEGKEKASSSRLDEATRKSLIRQFLNYQIGFDDIANLPVIRDCRGRTTRLGTLWSKKLPLTVAPSEKSSIAERIASSKRAMVLHYDDLRIWGVETPEALMELLICMAEKSSENPQYYCNKLYRVNIISFDLLSDGFLGTNSEIGIKELKPRESAARNSIQYASDIMAKRLAYHFDVAPTKRKITVGISDVADAWTDTLSYIAINRVLLGILDSGYYGAVQIALCLLHEYCHDASDINSHEHDMLFYEKYHDISGSLRDEVVGHVASSMYKRYLNELGQKQELLPKEAYRDYKWPVVNELDVYQGTMNGLGLSPLAKIVLDASGANYKATKKKLSLTIQGRGGHKAYERIHNTLINHFKKDGFDMPDEKSMVAAGLDWEAKSTRKQAIWNKSGHDWAVKHGHDIEAVAVLLRGDKRGSYLDFVQNILVAICLDKNSGLTDFEGSELYPTRIVGSASYLHKFKTQNTHWPCHRDQWNNSNMASSESKRTAYAVEAIKDIVAGIIDPTEKQKFINTFLKEDMAIQL